MEYKKFNQELHDACDPPAREAVTEWVAMRWGLECQPNPDKYGVDLIVYRKGQLCGFIEVETRDWGVKHCPYDSIHIAQRKEKLFTNEGTLIFVTTRDFENAYWCKAEYVKNSPLIEVPNRAVKRNEYFYDVPIELFQYVDLTEPF
jgi:hypothetical protein